MLKVFTYQGCTTCRNATKWLRAKNITFTEIAIRETPPTLDELASMLRACNGDLRTLFNTSGQDYRALNMKDKLPEMTQAEALALLSTNGNLVKRPFAVDEKASVHLVGFREAEWQAALV
jgi:arsenate reductase